MENPRNAFKSYHAITITSFVVHSLRPVLGDVDATVANSTESTHVFVTLNFKTEKGRGPAPPCLRILFASNFLSS
jgi:hypothetical protein